MSADFVEPVVFVSLTPQVIKGGIYLTWPKCQRKSRLEENKGAPYHCAAGIGPDVTVKDKHLNELKLFEGGVLAICEYSGMDSAGPDGKKRVHWGPCVSTCSYPPNVALINREK